VAGDEGFNLPTELGSHGRRARAAERHWRSRSNLAYLKHTKSRAPKTRLFVWLGKRYGNITFEDDSLDFDLSEIYSVFDDSEGDK